LKKKRLDDRKKIVATQLLTVFLKEKKTKKYVLDVFALFASFPKNLK
jgi:hypothetical protein